MMYKLSILLFLITVLSCNTLIANTAIHHLTDPALSNCLKTLMIKHQWQTAADVKSIKCHNMGISSTQGIEQFSQIESLSLYKNSIKTIHLSGFKQLEKLNLAGNELSQLKLSQLPRLKTLYIFKNRLVKLHLETMPQLVQIKANNNQLTSATMIAAPKLSKLYLFDNQLEYFELNDLLSLTYLDVRQNPMPDDFYDFLDAQSYLTARHDGNMDDWD